MLLGALSAFVAVFPQLLINKQAGEFYSSKIFPWLAFVPQMVSNYFYFSLTEMFVVVGSVFVIVYLIYFIVRFVLEVKHKGWKSALFGLTKFVRIVVTIVLVVLLVFQLLHGMNYRRTSPIEKLQIGVDEHTYEEYCEALDWAYNGMVAARQRLGQDYNGVAHFGCSFDEAVDEANMLLDAFSKEYNLNMSENYVRAKPVMLSHLWRYTWIVGAYDMFLGEANINTDYMDVAEVPVTMCHELSHVKGYARETDCNVIAVLACIHSNRSEFRYAGYCAIYFDIRSKVIDIAKNCDYDLPDSVRYPVEVYHDLVATSQYDDIFRGDLISDTVAEVSDNVNNSFLEANGQEGGVETYIVPMDIYVDFYFDYIKGAT